MTSLSRSTRSRPACSRSCWRESAWTRARALLSIGMVLGLGAVGTSAQWSQTVTAQTGLFSTGTVDLKLNDSSSSFSFTPAINLRPGGTTSLSGMITLRNDGTANLQYLMDLQVRPLTTAVTTPDAERGNAAMLAANLTLEVFAGGTSTGTTCTGGTQVVPPRTLTADSVTRPLVTVPRTVDRGASDSLCVRMTLGGAAPRATRMAQVGVTFTANAQVR